MLGIVYDSEEMFTTDIIKIGLYGEKRYGKGNLEKYYQKVKMWVLDEMNIQTVNLDTSRVLVDYYGPMPVRRR